MRGVVRQWSEDEGWGVLDGPGTPGGCWAHFSAVGVAGYRGLEPGQVVEFEAEPVVDQDGFRFRAVRVTVSRTETAGTEPAGTGDADPPAAYASRLTLTFDEPGQGAAAE